MNIDMIMADNGPHDDHRNCVCARSIARKTGYLAAVADGNLIKVENIW